MQIFEQFAIRLGLPESLLLSQLVRAMKGQDNMIFNILPEEQMAYGAYKAELLVVLYGD